MKTVVESLDPQAIEWMNLVVEETARIGDVAAEELTAAIARIDLTLEPEYADYNIQARDPLWSPLFVPVKVGD